MDDFMEYCAITVVVLGYLAVAGIIALLLYPILQVFLYAI
jgi:hypothetical protein